MTNNTLLETVQTLERRAQRLEEEAALLRQGLAQLAAELAATSPVVARYVIEGETYEITQADVDAVRANLVKTWPDDAAQELALANKMAERLQKLSPAEQERQFFTMIEEARAAAIADGTAIEDERELEVDSIAIVGKAIADETAIEDEREVAISG